MTDTTAELVLADLKQRGWQQGASGKVGSPTCLGGAIWDVLASYYGNSNVNTTEAYKRVHDQFMDIVCEAFPSWWDKEHDRYGYAIDPSRGTSLPMWNDAKERTFDDIEKVCQLMTEREKVAR